MAVPSSGELKLWDNIWNQEIGGTQGENSLHSASVYAGFSTPDAMSDFYGWSDVEPPTVSTLTSGATTYNSICARGCINTTGNENPSRGFYFGTNSSAPTSNTKYTLSGTQGVGAFACNRTGLSYAVTYYWWAFACNSAGESVGNRCQAGTPYPPFTPTCLAPLGPQKLNSNFNFGPVNARGFYNGHATVGYTNPYSAAYVAHGSSHGKALCVSDTITQCLIFTNSINCAKACAQPTSSPDNWGVSVEMCNCSRCWTAQPSVSGGCLKNYRRQRNVCANSNNEGVNNIHLGACY